MFGVTSPDPTRAGDTAGFSLGGQGIPCSTLKAPWVANKTVTRAPV
jgi:hypothetical protein